MFGLGVGEILLILAFALIFIGPKKLPELAKNLGKSIREFQKAKDELLSQVNHDDDHNDHHHDNGNEKITEDNITDENHEYYHEDHSNPQHQHQNVDYAMNEGHDDIVHSDELTADEEVSSEDTAKTDDPDKKISNG